MTKVIVFSNGQIKIDGLLAGAEIYMGKNGRRYLFRKVQNVPVGLGNEVTAIYHKKEILNKIILDFIQAK